MWPEIQTAKNENRHELILPGQKINERLVRDGLDPNLFTLVNLNYLNLSDTTLSLVPDDISKLSNLQSLVLFSNKLTEVNSKVFELEKLKVLDLSRNEIEELSADISKLCNLTTLNVSSNKLSELPSFHSNTKLTVLNAANNKIREFPKVCFGDLANLSDVQLNGNEIESIPGDVSVLPSLKSLDISLNKLKSLPGNLVDCNKLKGK